MPHIHLLVTALGSLLASATPGEPAAPMGSVVRVQGQVDAVQSSAAGELVTALVAGDPIPAGTIVRTGADGRAQLLLDDRSLVSLGPGTEIDLAAVGSRATRRHITVKLVVGVIWARVSRLLGRGSEFEVEGPSAVAGVRGTSFFVEAPEGGGETRVTVLRGRVEMRDADAQLLLVRTLERGLARAGGESRVEPVSPDLVEALRERLAMPSWTDAERMERTWRTVVGGMDATWNSAGAGRDREAIRRATLGDIGGAEMPLPLMSLEPPAQTIVHGRIELEPAPN